MLSKNFSRQHFVIFVLFSKKIGLIIHGDNLYEMSKPVFWEKKKKNIIKLSSAKFAPSGKGLHQYDIYMYIQISFFFF